MSSNGILYPNVTSLPGQSGASGAIDGRSTERLERKDPNGPPSEFDQVLDNLSQVKSPLKFSSHATQRLRDRKIDLDSGTMLKLNEAIDKADAKGVQDTLVLTKDAALIVNVKNRTVVTAMDRSTLTGNVFTNIDGAVLI